MIAEKTLLIIISILGVGFFEGMETALLSTTAAALAKLKERYPERARLFSLWEERPHYIMSAIVVGTNTFFMAVGVLAASLSIDLAEMPGVPRAAGVILPFFVTALVLIFGEIMPKVYSRKNHEKVCAFGIRPLSLFAAPIAPFTAVLVKISETVLRPLGFRASGETPFLTREELHLILKEEESTPAAMLSSVLTFGERKIREIMAPRSGIFAVNYDSGFEKIIPQAVSSHFSRIPVYKKSVDNIIGLIYTRDLVLVRDDAVLYVLDDLLRPALFVPENAPISKVLKEFKSGGHHMAIVVDEYGVTKGLVTAEDVVEEIVGEIYDEFDNQPLKEEKNGF